MINEILFPWFKYKELFTPRVFKRNLLIYMMNMSLNIILPRKSFVIWYEY